jgi:hypothetical protein
VAFPVVAGTMVSTGGSSSACSVDLPGSISAGNLLIMVLFTIAAPSTPSGWTSIVTTNAAGLFITVFAKSASGSEGATVSVTCTDGDVSIHQAFRITGHSGLPAGNAATGSNGNPDPPNRNPGSAADYLWLAFGSHIDVAYTITGAPTNFTNLSVGQLNDVAELASARRELNASSLDPGAFTRTGGGVNDWQSVTLSIAPGSTTINATGAPASGAADVDGTVGVTVNATGALSSQAAAVVGDVEVIASFTGALASQASTIIGAINKPIFTGALQSQASAVVGDVEATVNATGALLSGASDVDGTVAVTPNFTGALVSAAASTTGAVTTDNTITVTGALQAQSPVITDTIHPKVSATGAIVAQSAIFSTDLEVISSFQGAIQAQSATTTGVFGELLALAFISAMQAGPASMSGRFSRMKIDRSDVQLFRQGHRLRFKVRVR